VIKRARLGRSSTVECLVDGNTAASQSKLDLGTQGLTWFAVDEEYAPRGRGYAGHFSIGNVTASLTASCTHG
jgi:hypothetical protein